MAEIPNELTERKTATTFYCHACKQAFDAAAARTEDRPDSPHPFEYFAPCPDCAAECTEAHWLQNLYAAWQNITGTKSPAASAKNLPPPGDPRAKFNALKSGLFAQKAKYFPGVPGRYPECGDCAHAADCETSGICLEISKIKMMVQRAVDSGDPTHLANINSGIQADLYVMIQRMLREIIADGVTQKTPVFTSHENSHRFVKDDNGDQIVELSVHPAVRALSDLLQKNGLSLNEMQLTTKTAGDQDRAMGHLKNDDTRTQTVADAAAARKAATDEFLKNFKTAAGSRAADPAFLEHGEESTG